MFSIVTGFELNPVHNPSELLDACRQAGIPESEAMQGMVSRISDRKLCLMCETTKRIPQPRKKVVKATKADTPEARKARVDSYIAWYTPERMFAEQSIFDN
jgi:hypothetical protein